MINTRGSFFAKYATISLLSQIVVILSGLLSVPILINGLGSERFGALTLVWALTGYFSIFDFGLSRAVTKAIGEKLGQDDTSDLPEIVGSSILVASVSGLLLGSLFLFFVPGLLSKYLMVDSEVYLEVKSSVQLLSIAFPVVIVSNFSRGVLEGFQRFDLINFIRIPAGVGLFLLPVAVLMVTNSFESIVFSLILMRTIEMIITTFYSIKEIPNFFGNASFSRSRIVELISFGGWISLINTVGPFLNYFDRFLIGYLLSVTAVTYYSVPFDLCLRLTIIPSSIVGVLFSAFSALVLTDKVRITNLVYKALKYTFFAIFPVASIISLYSFEILKLWVGPELASNSYIILQILSLSTIVSAASYVPSALIQAAGRPDKIGKYLIIVAISYAMILYWIIPEFGLFGVACSFLMRSFLDSSYYMVIGSKYFDASRQIKRFIIFSTISLALLIILLILPISFVSTTLILLVLAPLYLTVVIKDVMPELKKSVKDI